MDTQVSTKCKYKVTFTVTQEEALSYGTILHRLANDTATRGDRDREALIRELAEPFTTIAGQDNEVTWE